MQFRVPQNIAMEDRIVGPLTVIQFSILAIGGLGSFMIFSGGLGGGPIMKGIGVFGGILTVTLAMGKFNDQPMYRFFRFIIAYALNPKTRVWHKTGADPLLITPVDHSHDSGPKQQSKHISRTEIARIAAAVDSRGRSASPLIAKPK